MRPAILFARARGLFPVLVILFVTAVVVVSLRSRIIWVPGSPEGSLVQTWLPLILSVAAARACFDASGGLAWPSRPALHLLEFFWLAGTGLILVALAAPGRAPADSSLGEIHAAVAVAVVTSTCYLLSLCLDFSAVACVGCVVALILIFAIGPVFHPGAATPGLWTGGRYEFQVAGALVLLSAAARSAVAARIRPGQL